MHDANSEIQHEDGNTEKNHPRGSHESESQPHTSFPAGRKRGCSAGYSFVVCCSAFATFYIFSTSRRGGWNSSGDDLSVGPKSRTGGVNWWEEATERVGTNHLHAKGYLTGDCATFLRVCWEDSKSAEPAVQKCKCDRQSRGVLISGWSRCKSLINMRLIGTTKKLTRTLFPTRRAVLYVQFANVG